MSDQPADPTTWRSSDHGTSSHDGRLGAMVDIAIAAGRHTLRYFRSDGLVICWRRCSFPSEDDETCDAIPRFMRGEGHSNPISMTLALSISSGE